MGCLLNSAGRVAQRRALLLIEYLRIEPARKCLFLVRIVGKPLSVRFLHATHTGQRTMCHRAGLPGQRGCCFTEKAQRTFAFTGTSSCLFAPGSDPGPVNPTPGTALPNSGFNAATLQPLVNATAFSSSNSVEGVRIFNGDGTGTVTGTNVSTTERPTPGPTGYPNFPASASSNTFTADFTYVVNSDGTFTTQLAGPMTGTFLTGPRSIAASRDILSSRYHPIDGSDLKGRQHANPRKHRTYGRDDYFFQRRCLAPDLSSIACSYQDGLRTSRLCG